MIEQEISYNWYPLSLAIKNTLANTQSTALSGSNLIPSANGTIVSGGSIQSPNYSAGNSGWIIFSKGNAEFANGTFRGVINASSSNLVQYDAIVDINGHSDYTKIEDAVTAGKKTIFVRKGTYILTSNIVLTNGMSLIGEDRDSTIINLGIYQIRATGGNDYSTGTVSPVSLSQTVVGVDTLWTTNLVVNDYIILEGIPYQITAVTDNTHLEISDAYCGISGTGLSYHSGRMVSNITIQNLSFINKLTDNTVGISLNMVVNSYFFNFRTKCGFSLLGINGIQSYYCFNSIFNLSSNRFSIFCL